MFFKQVGRNAARSRRGNGLFFGSLVIAIVAFYTLLSLDRQDVMRFLSTVESEAVQKLMTLIPAVYGVSLFFVFFLVYFACKYQMDSRRREFGMYLMLGMKRSRLFFLLLCETLWNSLLSLLAGLPAALLLTEGISLVTSKLVGLGIIGHRFTFSAGAVLWTVCGYVLVQLFSMLLLCIPFGKAEPAQLLHSDAPEKQAPASGRKSTVFLVLGVLLLLFAYGLGIFGLSWGEGPRLLLTLLLLLASGALGTFFLYRGLGGFLGRRAGRKSRNAAGLAVFTGRQVQENVLCQHRSLAVSSLLLLVALSCVSYGIAVGVGRSVESRSTDFSVLGAGEEVAAVLERPEIRALTETSYPVWLSRTDAAFGTEGFVEALRQVPGAESAAESFHLEYVISETSYNQMLAAMGKEPLNLGEGEAALYSSMGEGDFYALLDGALKQGVKVGIGGKEYGLLPGLAQEGIVADRSITLYAALIVPEELYRQLAAEEEPFCWNLHLSKSLTEELGLMQAIQKMEGLLAGAGLEYDSFLGGIGRNLFYAVSASYLTLYLGILFLLIANTVIGLKYLIQQRENKHRYVTLLMLGADTEELCSSVKKQIQLFFSLVLGVAACSSAAAIYTMFHSFTKLPAGTSIPTVAILAAAALAVFAAVEAGYLAVVKRTACREIRTLQVTDRGDAA